MLGAEPTIGIGMTEQGTGAVFTKGNPSWVTNFDRITLDSVASGALKGYGRQEMSKRVAEAVQYRSTRPESEGHLYVQLSGDDVKQLQRGNTKVKEMKPLSYCSASVAKLYG